MVIVMQSNSISMHCSCDIGQPINFLANAKSVKRPDIKRVTMTLLLTITTLLLSSACSLAPVSPRDSASSVGKGIVKIDTNLLPTPAINTTFGLTDNLDIGLDIEDVHRHTIWSRYSLLNNKTGVSVAAASGAFTYSDSDTNGFYAGALLSYRKNSRVELTAGYRHSKVSYYPDQYGAMFDLYSHVDNREDLSETGQLNVAIALRLKPHLQLSTGFICQHQYKNRNQDIKSDVCLPLLGLSFFSD